MQLSQKLIRCTWDGDHEFVSSAAGTGLVRKVCENCRAVSFESVDFLSTRAMSMGESTKVSDLMARLHSNAA